MRNIRRISVVVVTMLAAAWQAVPVSAQLDPLLFVKRVPPTVIVVFDTSMRMLEDGNGNFYDPYFYSTTADAAVMAAFPTVDATIAKTYRRIYRNLQFSSGTTKYTAESITASAAVWDPANSLTSNNAADIAFLDPTRYNIAKRGLAQAVDENRGSAYRWGLIRLRQSSPAWRQGVDCDKTVLISSGSQASYKDADPCVAGDAAGSYGIYAPSVAAASWAQATAPSGTVVVTPGANTAAAITTVLARGPNHDAALIPAGMGGVGYEDRPIAYALEDAKSAAAVAMAADTDADRSCRNTIVILITGGKNDGDATYTTANNAATVASSFQTVSGGGVTRRVPIYVVAVRPNVDDETSLQEIATNSGGQYRRVSTATEVTRAVNFAVQAGFARATDVDAQRVSEYVPVSPVVGTVNLKNALAHDGSALPNTSIVANPGGQALAQRSNMMLTAGFTLPGFDGSIRAFRTYRPEPDSTKPTGWKFVSDGTKLWPALDERTWLAGKARTPIDPNTRNIYTFIPDPSGGGSVIAFNTANEAQLRAALGTTDATATMALISQVRSQALGAVIGSTPAIMDPPSLDPPPDDDYGRSDAATSFAGRHKDRRAIIFFGANDGMIHAVDARTGYEVWAFIPYNLLPKLNTLVDGQPVEQFEFFVDSSPKVAEVKINGSWKSLLIIGQGPGGTFYQAFDVSEAGMGVSPEQGDIVAVNSLLAQFDTPNESIAFKWAFPNYGSFDPSYRGTFTVYDGTPGGVVKLWGDLASSATYVEKTVGYTWSDPAVGTLDATRTQNAVIVGSGFFSDIEGLIPGRGSDAPKAGASMYLLDVETGQPIGNASGATCPTISSGSGSAFGCVSVGNLIGNGVKNALQADPSAAGESGATAVSKAYIGDLDGKYWRFNFTAAGEISATQMVNTGTPIYASSALLFVGSTDVYMFFATGSDLLPASAPGGMGTFRLYGLKDNYPGSGATTKFAHDLIAVTQSNGRTSGERPSTAPSVAGDIVFYTTTVESADTPCADYSSNLYSLTFQGGAAYDTNNNGRIDTNESPIARTMAGRATSPFIVDQHLYVGTASAGGAFLESFGDPEDFNNGIGQVGVRILSWREIR